MGEAPLSQQGHHLSRRAVPLQGVTPEATGSFMAGLWGWEGCPGATWTSEALGEGPLASSLLRLSES